MDPSALRCFPKDSALKVTELARSACSSSIRIGTRFTFPISAWRFREFFYLFRSAPLVAIQVNSFLVEFRLAHFIIFFSRSRVRSIDLSAYLARRTSDNIARLHTNATTEIGRVSNIRHCFWFIAIVLLEAGWANKRYRPDYVFIHTNAFIVVPLWMRWCEWRHSPVGNVCLPTLPQEERWR